MNDNLPGRPDAYLPAEMAKRAEDAGVKKAATAMVPLAVLAVLAGAFIALGAVFYTTVTTGASEQLPYGLAKFMGGLAFCLGLILVVVAGAELFTGDCLIVMAWSSDRVSTAALARVWSIVFLGNLAGAAAIVLLVYLSGHWQHADGAVGANALKIATTKCELDFVPAVFLGVLCNVLVCLAVWMSFSARTTTDKIISLTLPITAFVAAGFEHSIANMYFVPAGLLIKATATPEFWHQIHRDPSDFANLDWPTFLLGNLLPVTLGNIIGGGLLVGAVYWLVYRRHRQD